MREPWSSDPDELDDVYRVDRDGVHHRLPVRGVFASAVAGWRISHRLRRSIVGVYHE